MSEELNGEDGSGAESVPVRWPGRWGSSSRTRARGVVLGGSAMMILFAAMIPATASQGLVVLGPVTLTVLGVAAVLLGLRQPFGGRTVEFVDSVALTDAESMPPDSWVHFIRQRRSGLLTMGALWAVAALLTTLAAAAVHIAIGGRAQAWLGVVFVLPAAALAAVIAVRQTVAEFRLGSFGRRPVGITIGRSGIAMIRLGDPLYVPWEAIESIEPLSMGGNRRASGPVPLIEIRLRHASADALTLTPAGADVHPWVVLAALEYYLRHPAKRAELGTTFGQRRLERWSAAVS